MMKTRLAPFAAIICAMVVPLPSAYAATVAYWRFEPGSLEVDSVGGHTLSNVGVVASADTSALAPGSGSAFFDGTHTTFSTMQALDLSSYEDLTIEYFIKTTQSATAIIIEHFGANIHDPGVIGSAINDIQLAVEGFQRGALGSTYISATPTVIADGAWHHVAITFDGSETGADRINLFVDGLNVGIYQAAFSPTGMPSFVNETFYVGSRGNTAFKFIGNLDELRISDAVLDASEFLIPAIPEPATIAIAGSALPGGLLRRRRRCRSRFPKNSA